MSRLLFLLVDQERISQEGGDGWNPRSGSMRTVLHPFSKKKGQLRISSEDLTQSSHIFKMTDNRSRSGKVPKNIPLRQDCMCAHALSFVPPVRSRTNGPSRSIRNRCATNTKKHYVHRHSKHIHMCIATACGQAAQAAKRPPS